MSRANAIASERTNKGEFPPDILLPLDRSQRRGLREQLEQHLRSAIQQGRLRPGSLLPPSRTLAAELGVARSVVVQAYEQLAEDGYVTARRGSGTRILPVARPVPPRPTSAAPVTTMRLLGGLPDPALFPRGEWLRHYRAALGTLPNPSLGYPGVIGAQQLRDALTGYLGRVRGVVTEPDRMLITAGITQALVLVCRALRARGVTTVAVEDPCFALHREAIANAGLGTVSIPIDRDGIDVAHLSQHDVGAVLVVPAHSYPTGTLMSTARRTALVEWADRRDAVIIEDDYDAEFRYDRAPIGALQGLAPERVVYTGGASKVLTPALRLGWLAAPGSLMDEVARQKRYDDVGTALLEQLALAGFIESGGFTRHLRRVRPVYRRRRDAMVTALAAALPDVRPLGIAAGLHIYVQLPVDSDEVALVAAARRQGIHIEAGAQHWAVPASAPPGLVLGYGAHREPDIRAGVAVLASIYNDRIVAEAVPGAP